MVMAIQDIAPAQRMQTGIPGLEQITGGGFRHGNSILVKGTPGSGKTALALQMVVNGILLYNEPGLIVSFEQFPQQLYRDGLGFGWDFAAMEKSGMLRMIFLRRDDLYSSFAEKESAAITVITDTSIDLRARRLAFDGVNSFWRLPLNPQDQQKAYVEFVLKLKALGLTPILTSNTASQDEDYAPDDFAVDCIVRLEHSGAHFPGSPRVRTIEVVKSRGHEILEGKHLFRIDSKGIRVSPYVPASAAAVSTHTTEGMKVSTGIADLDVVLEGGFQAGSRTMIAGLSGTGKTTLASHFLNAGIQQGESAVFITTNEDPERLVRNMDHRGMALRSALDSGKLTVLPAGGPGTHLIEFYHVLREQLEESGASRVVIDSLPDLVERSESRAECGYYLALFTELLSKHGITAVFTSRLDEMDGLATLGTIPYAAHMDNVIYLGLLELEGRLRRIMALFKTRGQYTDDLLRELVMTSTDMRISTVLSGLTGILHGSPTGRISGAGREFLEPLLRIRDFVNTAEVHTVEQARYVTDNIRQEFNVLAEKIAQHFDLGLETSDARGDGARTTGS